MPAKREPTRRGHALWATPRYDTDWSPQTLAWQDRALCREVFPDLFFIEAGSDDDAKKICRRCPVRGECLEWALATDDEDYQYGVFGGVGPKARRRMRRDRAAVAA